MEYDEAGTLVSTAGLVPDFENHAQVKYCVYDTTQTPTGFGLIEAHGITMDWATHKRLHIDPGTVRASGGALTTATYVVKLPSDTYNAANSALVDIQPGVDQTIIADEDLQTTLAALLEATGYTTMRYDYVALKWLWSTSQSAPYYRSGNVPQYNPAIGGASLVNVTNTAYYCTYLVASPMGSNANSQLFRYMWTPGRTQYIPTTGTSANRLIALNNALAEDPSSLDLSTRLSTEYVIIGKVVTSYDTGSTGNNYRLRIEGYQQIVGSRTRSVTISGVTGISAVNTDATLTGTGTILDPLSVLGSYNLSLITAVGSNTLFTPPASTVSYSAQVYIADNSTYANLTLQAILKNTVWEYSLESVGDVVGAIAVNTSTGVITYTAAAIGSAKLLVNYINF